MVLYLFDSQCSLRHRYYNKCDYDGVNAAQADPALPQLIQALGSVESLILFYVPSEIVQTETELSSPSFLLIQDPLNPHSCTRYILKNGWHDIH